MVTLRVLPRPTHSTYSTLFRSDRRRDCCAQHAAPATNSRRSAPSERNDEERDDRERERRGEVPVRDLDNEVRAVEDRKSTRLNSSHLVISYAVFCLKKNSRK